MENLDYKNLLVELISALIDKTGYLKTIDSRDANFNKDYFDGMAMAYHQVMDLVKSTIEYDEDLDLSDFGLEEFEPNDILDYKPIK